MKFLSRTDLRNQLSSKQIAPVYLLFGAETYLRDLAASTIAKFALPEEGLREFNHHETSLNTSGVMDALSAAEQLPFGAERRVVIIRDLFLSTNRQTTSLRENVEAVLESYLDNPSPTSVVIFVAAEVDKRLRASKLFAEKAVSVEFSAMSEGESVKWVRDRMRIEEVDADERTIRAIIGLAGEDAGKLQTEVAKLATAALPDKIITFELVERLVKNSRILSNFDLTDHLIAGRKEAALTAMSKILDDGAEPLMLLGLLSYNFRQMFIAKELMNEGLDRPEIIRTMRLRGNQSRIFEAARKSESARFEHIIKRLAETDVSIKTSVGQPRIQIEMLVCELAGAS